MSAAGRGPAGGGTTPRARAGRRTAGTVLRRLAAPAWRRRILVGVHVLAVLLLGRAAVAPFARDLADRWLRLDFVLRATALGFVQPADVVPITFVDIDDALYRDRWGSPATTPRDALAAMATRLADGGAGAVVLDIDVSWRDTDGTFDAFLAGYEGPAPLVLVKRLEDRADGRYAADAPIDSIVARNPLLHWAHSHFYLDADQTVRRWAPWLPVCADGGAAVLPSVALRVLMLTRPADYAAVVPVPQPPCGRDEVRAPEYTVIFREDLGRAADGAGLPAIGRDGRPGPALRLRARDVLDGLRIDEGTYMRDRVAIIGGSHAAGRDLWRTPLGGLPGAVVLASTVVHAPLQVEMRPPSRAVYRLLVLGLFLLLLALSASLRDLVGIPLALVAAGALTLVALRGFGYYRIFDVVETSILLLLQYKLLRVLFVSLWDDLQAYGWRGLLAPERRQQAGA
jgi:CHASE2 domain-containing sensor protein